MKAGELSVKCSIIMDKTGFYPAKIESYKKGDIYV